MVRKAKSKAKLASVKSPKVDEKARNAFLAKEVQAFIQGLQASVAKFGIKSDDLTVTVHLHIKVSK